MPELPEVETTRRGIAPHIERQLIRDVAVRERRLRWPVPARLNATLSGQMLHSVQRRAKYLLLEFDNGWLLLHLGMSGSLRIVDQGQTVGKHDHIDFVFENGKTLRYCDPRRFGSVHWHTPSPAQHPLLRNLGPEPLEDAFSPQHLYTRSRKKIVAVKSFIMNSAVVVGVGNIYANEALYRAGLRPTRAAGRIALPRYERLVHEIKAVLHEAIAEGGTTLRDFVGGDGQAGYFRVALQVYGRGGEPCLQCSTPLKSIRLGQRATVFCAKCQT
ncbi:MAG: bifunctional DNA-formamidopyrimidine glycosylase/DNA-(apurinic or apyrimidinic site) lyase [Pseudomonadales bacterium]